MVRDNGSMRVAIIDLGTNSVRFDIHEVSAKGRVRRLYREKLMVRLGEGVFTKRKLDSAAIQRTLQAFIGFKDAMTRFQVHRIVSFATSALREAKDGHKLIQLIRERTGISVRVISGAEEALLIARGILAHERLGKKSVGLVDIGGGSTEISICEAKEVIFCDSFPLGTSRLQQLYLSSMPAKKDAIERLRMHIQKVLRPKLQMEGWPEVTKVIGSSGTIRTLASLIEEHFDTKKYERKHVKSILKIMKDLTASQLQSLPGMDPRRADMIVAGTVLFDEVMDALGAKEFSPTSYALRDGIFIQEIKNMRHVRVVGNGFPQPRTFARFAIKLGVSKDAVRRSWILASTLFERLQPIHRLRREWSDYLVAAAIMRNVGQSVSLVNHEFHSHYIVSHGDFHWKEPWESEFVSKLCLYHGDRKINLKSFSFSASQTKLRAFLKLVALLRLVDALDVGAKSSVRIQSVSGSRKNVVIDLAGRGLLSLAALRIDRHSSFFEKVFGISLTIRLSR